MNRIIRYVILYLLVFLVIIGIISIFNGQNNQAEEMKVNEFMQALDNNEIASMEMRPSNGVMSIVGELEQDNQAFNTEIPATPNFIEDVTETAESQGVGILDVKEEEQPSGWVTFLTTMIPFVIIFILFFFLLNQSQGGGGRVMNFGKSKAKMYSVDKKKVRFNDVAGADVEKQELVEVVDFLKDPSKFTAIGAKIPKVVLLVGPPGTGKTLLARAVAGEAGVPFFSISGSDFVEMFVGVGASRVRDLFENAKKNAPCIIFIDEIDAVGRQRGAGLGG